MCIPYQGVNSACVLRSGFKVEPQDRMDKVYTEIETLWQVLAYTHCLTLAVVPLSHFRVKLLKMPARVAIVLAISSLRFL